MYSLCELRHTSHGPYVFLLLCSLFLGNQPQGGKETTLHGHEEIPELRQKLVKRILNWATEELMTAAYTSVRAFPRALLLATHTHTRALSRPHCLHHFSV